MNFDKWFKAQFGALPKPTGWFIKQRKAIESAKLLYQTAQFRYEREEALKQKYTAALYARNAFEKKRKKT